MKYIKLNNDVQIPQFGLGCGGIYRKKDLLSKDSLRLLNVYCRTIGKERLLYDSESVGYHQDLLGMANRISDKRDNMFICTKLSNYEQRDGNIEKAFERSLNRLHTEYIDLYLMHWPQTGTFIDSWLQMEQIYFKGKAKAIGVCNFHRHHLEELMKHATVIPAVNQFEIHPLFTQKDLIQYCRDVSIQPMSYTPLGRMHDVLIKAKALRMIAEKYNKTVPQIIIRWNIQQDLIVIPKTTRYSRVKEYLECFGFSLTDIEMEKIDEINDNVRLRYNPDKCDFMYL